MSASKTNRRVYSAEELHRLRGTCSQPKLSEAIDKNDGGDAELVKEHVLRGSKSFTARSFRSRASGNSLRVPSNKENYSNHETESPPQNAVPQAHSTGFVLGEVAPNLQFLRGGSQKIRPSPTPSLKKKKAEAIVKAHGSPQHVRVTAGGRIVPSEQSPLCHPRYGYSAIKVNGGLIRFAPNHPMGKAQWTQATQNGFVAQDMNGRLCQIVDGMILPLNEVDGALQLYVPAPNLNVSTRGSSFGRTTNDRIGSLGEQQLPPLNTQPGAQPEPSQAVQLNALQLEYAKLEHELKELDKTEVLHGRAMGKVAKDALFGKRRELVTGMDRIRRAIKSIKSAPPPDAPTSPRAMQNRGSVSPPRNRLPAFLQDRMQHDTGNPSSVAPQATDGMSTAGSYGPFFGLPNHNPYLFPPSTSASNAYNMQPFTAGPSPLFVPPFDGSMMQPYLQAQDTMGVDPSIVMNEKSVVTATGEPLQRSGLAQTDGASSLSDLHKTENLAASRALEIKAPEQKSVAALRSTLNPMSPAYKPGSGVLQPVSNSSHQKRDHAKSKQSPTLSAAHQLKPLTTINKRSTSTTDTLSPTKKPAHLSSSSASSFETADFFPQNTREYSTRKAAYVTPSDPSEEKENISPPHANNESSNHGATTPTRDSYAPTWNSQSVRISRAYDEPLPAPGTPIMQKINASTRNLSVTVECGSAAKNDDHQDYDRDSMPNRQTHNISPKAKRSDWRFARESLKKLDISDSSSSEGPDARKWSTERPQPHPTTIDFSERSTAWIEGYRAGLAHRSVGPDSDGEFLDGYCAGLLKSKTSSPSAGVSKGSPKKQAPRRPSPANVQPTNEHSHGTANVPFEINFHSTDALKQAVFAPGNEFAILSPTPDGPHVDEPPFHLGSYRATTTRNNDYSASTPGLAITTDRPCATAATQVGMIPEDVNMAQNPNVDFSASGPINVVPEVSTSPILHTAELPGQCLTAIAPQSTTPFDGISSRSTSMPNNRVMSMTSIDQSLGHQYPGRRVFSPPMDWKSTTSVAQAAGLATGFFASSQFDGANPQRRVTSMPENESVQGFGRFREGSIDGITNPPNSPQQHSPTASPTADSKASRPAKLVKDSPTKSGSPAKTKFEHIAEKVGIKVAGNLGAVNKSDEGNSPSSPSGKRRWRDVWRTSAARKDNEDL